MARFDIDVATAVRPRETVVLDEDGVDAHLLKTPRWTRTSRGLYVPGGTARTPAQRIVSAAALCPDSGALGGWAAAHVRGVPYLDGLDAADDELPIDVLLPPGLHRLDVPGVHYRKDRVVDGEAGLIGDLCVTTLLRTAVDLACWAQSLAEAVVRLDLILAAGLPRSELVMVAPRRRRGAVQARQAIDLARRGSRSPGESRLRVLYVREVSDADLLLNCTILDADGRFVAITDLFDPDAGLAMEYDGAQWDDERKNGHRDRRQHREDNVREEDLERLGIIVVRADAADLGPHRRQTAYRLQRARMDGLSRDRRRDRWIVQPQTFGEG